jgi:protein-S-isoprenylcysteine O-methyltransferase Ste14
MPRRLAVMGWIVGAGAVHVGLPVALARRTRRAAVTAPAAIRQAGLGCVGLGAAGLAWSLAQHFKAAPAGGYEVVARAPEYLLRSGPYRFSRNPMYVAELGMWAGWTLLFANPVLGGATALWALAMRYAVTLEEAALAARFGDAWQQYAAQTPRWIGRATVEALVDARTTLAQRQRASSQAG